MKKLLLFFTTICISGSLLAQAYVVSVCGNVSNLNGSTPTLDLYYWQNNSSNSGNQSAVVDSLGNYCINYSVVVDSGIYATTGYAIYMSGCGNLQGDTVYYLSVISDTTYIQDYTCDSCNTSSYTNTTAATCGYSNGSATGTLSGGASPISYVWSDGQLTQTATGLIGGNYYSVTMTDNIGCMEIDSGYVSSSPVFDVWVACTSATDSTTSDGSATVDTLSGGVGPFSYAWNNGGNSQTINGLSPGTYMVTVTDANGCTGVDSCMVTSAANCSASFTYYEDSTQTGMVYFNSSSNGVSPFTYFWNFGDNSMSTSANPMHMYGTGLYYACVTITDANGCSDTYCDSISVTGNSQNCSVYFTYVEDSVNPGTVEFTSYPNGSSPFTYQWYFSDGATSTQADPTHTYIQGSGWEWAYVVITDANGCSSYYCGYVNITTPPPSNCDAYFYPYIDTSFTVAGEVSFYDYSYSGGTIVSWAWDFGDGNTSTQQDPVHVYAAAGSYTICLTITDNNGCSDSYCQTYYIDPAWWISNPWGNSSNCSAGFVSFQDTSMSGLIYLIDISTGSNLYYTWDFGNGTIINSQYPFVSFNNTGAYYVCLDITDTVSGCQDTFCDSVIVDSTGSLVKSPGNWGISVIPAAMPQFNTAVREITAISEVLLYPNPVQSDVNIRFSLKTPEAIIIRIMDISGRTVRTEQVSGMDGVNNVNLDLKSLPDGLYLFNINARQFNQTERLIKIRN